MIPFAFRGHGSDLWHRLGRTVGQMRLLAFVLLLLGLGAAASTALAGGRYEGVASCAGSTCHGRAEGNGAVVRQDELAHWQNPALPQVVKQDGKRNSTVS